MDVILLEKIRNLGALGDKVKVKSGFARNYLVPQGKAVYATESNVEKFEKRRVELEKIAAERHQKAMERKNELESIPALSITMKAGEEGKLFGSVGVRDITDALEKAGVVVEKREIRLPESGVLRSVGEFEIIVELDSDVVASIKLNITSESAS
ncbi:MAG: 50S ribosomal protein L9 [Gammaproteobacteria bacterium RIFCSPHIGHO2_12_FULL_43_28]|nr:MAG: 50S ribosomal protein L9 [Gammaproteobacteria bacterium RIFCSPHIGHO2_12_FULL_43_28]